MLKTPYEGINKWSKLLHSEKHTNLIYRLAMSYYKTSHTKQGIHQNLEFKKNFKLKESSRTQTFYISKFYLLLESFHWICIITDWSVPVSKGSQMHGNRTI